MEKFQNYTINLLITHVLGSNSYDITFYCTVEHTRRNNTNTRLLHTTYAQKGKLYRGKSNKKPKLKPVKIAGFMKCIALMFKGLQEEEISISLSMRINYTNEHVDHNIKKRPRAAVAHCHPGTK